MPADVRAIEPDASHAPKRVAIVASRYNEWITDRLLDGALDAARRADAEIAVEVARVPGAYEIPAAAAACARSGRYGAVVCLGCVIRGETRHDRYIADAVAQALQRIACDGGAIAVGFGLLTVDGPEQAEARAGGTLGNKGAEAMEAALETGAVIRAIQEAGS